MGLDMYFEKQRIQYLDESRKKAVIDDEEAGYFRKFNALHNWIVTHCGNNVDDQYPIKLEFVKLKELLNILELIDEKTGNAKTLLPTQSGFFFGSTEYDDYYYDNIEVAILIIKKLIEWVEKNKEEEPLIEHNAIYQASW